MPGASLTNAPNFAVRVTGDAVIVFDAELPI